MIRGNAQPERGGRRLVAGTGRNGANHSGAHTDFALVHRTKAGGALAPIPPIWQGTARRAAGFPWPAARRCRSSVVEHSLGKGEVDSSILSGSTM
jgi:hypothetical protein